MNVMQKEQQIRKVQSLDTHLIYVLKKFTKLYSLIH